MAEIITILLAEAAIEPFPKELVKKPKVKRYFARTGKDPKETILDVNEHNFLLKYLSKAYKRARPDITHLALLACQGSIIAKKKKLSVIVHTYTDNILYIRPETRIPRSLKRFKGLVVQLFKYDKVPPEEKEKPLIYREKETLNNFIRKSKKEYDKIIEFSVEGEKRTLPSITKEIIGTKKPLLIFGAFQKGHIETLSNELVDKKIAIFEKGLDLFTVISHILAAIEYEEELQSEGVKIK